MPHPHHFAEYAAERSERFVAEAAHLRQVGQVPPAEGADHRSLPGRGVRLPLRHRLVAIVHYPLRRPAEGVIGR